MHTYTHLPPEINQQISQGSYVGSVSFPRKPQASITENTWGCGTDFFTLRTTSGRKITWPHPPLPATEDSRVLRLNNRVQGHAVLGAVPGP